MSFKYDMISQIHKSIMNSLQKVMDIIYSKAESFSNEEYLTLMNELLAVSKVLMEEKSQNVDLDDDDEELDSEVEDNLPARAPFNSPVIIPSREPRSRVAYQPRRVDLTPLNEMDSLYNYNNPEPVVEEYVRSEVIHYIRTYLDAIEAAESRTQRAKLAVCVYAYIFKHYKFIIDNPRFKSVVRTKLESFLTNENDAEEFRRLEKYDILSQWFTVLNIN